MTAENASPDIRSWRRAFDALEPLLPYAWRYKGRIALALVALGVAALATLALPLAVRGMIDHGFSTDDPSAVNAYFGAMVGVVAILALASGSRYYLVMTLGERIVADLRADFFRHLTTLDAAFYDRTKTGELTSRLTADTTQLKSVFGSSVSIALRNLFMFAGAVVMMILTSPKLTGVALTAIPFIVLPLIGSARAMRRRSRHAQDRLATASAYAAENLAAMRTMQACNAQNVATARFGEAAEGAYTAARDATQTRALVTSVTIFLAFGSVVAMLWLGAQDVLAERMTTGVLSQFVLYAVLAASSLGELSQVWTEVSAAAGAAGRIGEILSIRPAVAPPAEPAPLPKPVRGRIVFDNVRFFYPGSPGPAAVDGLSFSVAPGERVAIVGPSGAGKSTVFQLLERFYDVSSGAITIDGVDLRALDPVELRAAIALAPQDPIVFGMSVAENIAYGREGASRSAIVAAAERAQAAQFIDALADGYDTQIGERGVTLSGGQRQRLAIARAILADAPILLLDEATSALDAENEALVKEALHDVMRGRTTLVIAHRLATVLEASRILVMSGGRIVEEGTHASLVAEGGLYARLARLQFDTSAEAAALEIA
ncbi:ABC transporter transmembrane domain-containing protein [Methylosinus sp. Ce-a6]|uniref:ABC transporter transmembrane domain-containing protein n=1 Tax=Methylosinus sp. Ce-a6 TaxID=2172005 RepID=UPI00135C8328|nr:ABC transporter transmembrane domain-containing protein [Methylosinus sp. Ce-a6]